MPILRHSATMCARLCIGLYLC